MKCHLIIASLSFILAFAMASDFFLDVWVSVNRKDFVKKNFVVDSVRYVRRSIVANGFLDGEMRKVGLKSLATENKIISQEDADKFVPQGKVFPIFVRSYDSSWKGLIQGRTPEALEEKYFNNGDKISRILFPIFITMGMVFTVMYIRLR